MCMAMDSRKKGWKGVEVWLFMGCVVSGGVYFLWREVLGLVLSPNPLFLIAVQTHPEGM